MHHYVQVLFCLIVAFVVVVVFAGSGWCSQDYLFFYFTCRFFCFVLFCCLFAFVVVIFLQVPVVASTSPSGTCDQRGAWIPCFRLRHSFNNGISNGYVSGVTGM